MTWHIRIRSLDHKEVTVGPPPLRSSEKKRAIDVIIKLISAALSSPSAALAAESAALMLASR